MSAAGKTAQEGEGQVRLYERWKKLYPQWAHGPFQRARRIVLGVLLFVFYVSPWLTWNGQPGVWFDIPRRQFTLFWTTFYPQEFVLLSWLLIMGAFSLFVVTVMAGRVWCGFACPQTVWTLAYVWLEKLVEGDRNVRMRLDRGPWNGRKIGRKALKWSLWALLAGSISVTFVGYFIPIRELLPRIAVLDLAPWEQVWLVIPAAGSFLFQGVLREQVCFHMCPYARFQSVMFDRDTLIISYDAERGDPRGSRGRKVDPATQGLGSCVDCKLCVHVCPTGIDIRDGLQYQCIGCAACIDACNGVMAKMGYAPDLVRYSSEHRDEHVQTAWLRPRLVGYATMLALMLGTFSWTLAGRVPLELDVIRDRNRLFRESWDGSVENVYTLKIMNRERASRTYQITASSALPVTLETPLQSDQVTVHAGSQVSLPVQLVSGEVPGAAHNTPVTFTVETVEAPHFEVREESRFLRPETSQGDAG